MKVEIELDATKIDYEAINKQIQEKLDAINFVEKYGLHRALADTVENEVDKYIERYFAHSSIGDVKDHIRIVVHDEILKIVGPKVKDALSQIPDEEISKLTFDLLPRMFITFMMSKMDSSYEDYKVYEHGFLLKEAENRFEGILHKTKLTT